MSHHKPPGHSRASDPSGLRSKFTTPNAAAELCDAFRKFARVQLGRGRTPYGVSVATWADPELQSHHAVVRILNGRGPGQALIIWDGQCPYTDEADREFAEDFVEGVAYRLAVDEVCRLAGYPEVRNA